MTIMCTVSMKNYSVYQSLFPFENIFLSRTAKNQQINFREFLYEQLTIVSLVRILFQSEILLKFYEKTRKFKSRNFVYVCYHDCNSLNVVFVTLYLILV